MELGKHLYVHIIESPSSDDLLLKRQEGGLISEALKLMDIKSQHLLAVNKDAIVKAFLSVFMTHSNADTLIPIIHISAHGDEQGILLTDGKLTWKELGEILSLLNKALNGYLLLFMSSCEGLSACFMAFKEGNDCPFFAMIGNNGKSTWAETFVFYTTIYHLLGKGTNINEAVSSAKAASGNHDFAIIQAADVKKLWELSELLKDENVKKFIEQLPQIIESIKAKTLAGKEIEK